MQANQRAQGFDPVGSRPLPQQQSNPVHSLQSFNLPLQHQQGSDPMLHPSQSSYIAQQLQYQQQLLQQQQQQQQLGHAQGQQQQQQSLPAFQPDFLPLDHNVKHEDGGGNVHPTKQQHTVPVKSEQQAGGSGVDDGNGVAGPQGRRHMAHSLPASPFTTFNLG